MPWRKITLVNERYRFVILAEEENINISELCREFGISRETGYKWLHRYREDGVIGLKDLSRKPKQCSFEISNDIIFEIVRQRGLHSTWGGRKIAAFLKREHHNVPSMRTIDRILERCELVTKRRRRRRKNFSRVEVIQATACNQVWTVDFKGWWRTGIGIRVEPLTIRDEYSKFILDIGALTSKDTESVKARFQACFEKYGLPLYIRSDNGTPFAFSGGLCGLTKLSVWWMKLGITPNRMPPASPQCNPGHERMHLDMKNELEALPAKTPQSEQLRFDRWRKEYNYERPHQALHDKTPAQRYRASHRKYDCRLTEYNYPARFHLRKVNCIGKINWKNKLCYLSKALAGETIGLEIVSAKRMNIWFGEYLLASTNPEYTFGLTEYDLIKPMTIVKKAA